MTILVFNRYNIIVCNDIINRINDIYRLNIDYNKYFREIDIHIYNFTGENINIYIPIGFIDIILLKYNHKFNILFINNKSNIYLYGSEEPLFTTNKIDISNIINYEDTIMKLFILNH